MKHAKAQINRIECNCLGSMKGHPPTVSHFIEKGIFEPLHIIFEITEKEENKYLFLPMNDWFMVAEDGKNFIFRKIENTHLTNTKQS